MADNELHLGVINIAAQPHPTGIYPGAPGILGFVLPRTDAARCAFR